MSKCIILTLLFFFFQYSGYHRDLHSFPTRRSSDLVYRLAYRLAGDDELAREFTQDTFVRAFERLDSFRGDRKSTRLNSSHQIISYAVFCLKKKKQNPPWETVNLNEQITEFSLDKHL